MSDSDNTDASLGGAVTAIGAAVGALFKVGGNIAEADSLTTAAQLEEQNAALAAASARIQGHQVARMVNQSLGTTQADIAGAGFEESGSALDLLKSSAQQGSLAVSLVNIQGAIQENAYGAKVGEYLAEAKKANENTTASEIGAVASIGGALLKGGEALASGSGIVGTVENAVSSGYDYITSLFTDL